MSDLGKQALRTQLLARRATRTSAEIELARAAISAHVLARCDAQGWQCTAGYVPLRTEPGSFGLLSGLIERGVRVLVPVLRADRDLDWTQWRAAPGPEPAQTLGVDAIADASAVLVPALAVTRDGTRLGRGGGSYDRALARVPAGVPITALLYDDEIVAELPREPWDVAVTEVITPGGWHRLATH